MNKICSKCFKEKSFSEFGIAKHHKDGLKSSCKECCRKQYEHKCLDCNNLIRRKNAKRCKSCAGKKLFDIKGRLKFNCIDCGKTISYGHKRCTKCHIKYSVGKNANNYRGVYYCIDCGKKLANIYAKRCKSCSNKGKRNPHFGITPQHTQRNYYKSICFRSSWEANFAKWLELSGIAWEYEKHRFNLEDCTYTPDFYLPEFDCYIEIKGWWQGMAKYKFFQLKKLKNIKLFDKKKLKLIGIL